MKAKVVKTELGWEPAYFDEKTNEWIVEPGDALPTKAQAQSALDKDMAQARKIDAADRQYQSQYASACGY